MQLLVNKLFDEEFGIANFQLVLLVEFLYELTQELRGAIFELDDWSYNWVSAKVALECKVHKHRDDSFQRLVEIVETIRHNSLKNSKQLVCNSYVASWRVWLNLESFCFHKLD